MRSLSFLDLAGSSDVRVLKSQLDLTAASTGKRFSPLLWALAIALVCSDATGMFGHSSLYQVLYLPVVVAVSVTLSAGLTALYIHRTAAIASLEDFAPWLVRLLGAQIAVGAAWGLVPWLLWDEGSSLNHVFLASCCIMAMSAIVVPRGSDLLMFVCSVAPISLMAMARFALGDGAMDYVLACAVPAFAVQMGFARQSVVSRRREETRLRFQVEDLARELEETRDDALKKRFEAEAANASKTAFLANMSHELRTPLNAILGFSEIIAEECFGPVGNARYKDYAGDIHASGAHLLSLINDLLDIAKIEAGRMEISPNPLEARRAFDIALKLISAKANEKQQTLRIHIDANAPPLHADERALKQILINLVSNAVKFTPEGGRIDVVASGARDGGFQIMVKDNGPGIVRDKLDKIFSPFSQVDNRYDRQAGGTGLGLALVRGLAELHGGRAWLESEPGVGTAAYVVLPVPRPEQGSVVA